MPCEGGPRRSQTVSAQPLNSIEVSVERRQGNAVLDAERRDPEIVFRNGLALLLQAKPKLRVGCGGRGSHVQHAATRHEAFHVGKVVDGAPGVERTVPQLPDHRSWQDNVVQGLSKEGAGLAREEGNRNAGMSATLLPLTEVDTLEFPLDDASHLLGIRSGHTA
jgi:hypothetical protein